MIQQENEPKISVLQIFLSIIIFFYINYSILFFLDHFKLQISIFLISAYLLTVGVYRYLPSYIYVLKDEELVLMRKFSERYFDDYSIKIDQIKDIKVKEKMSFKFWNNFYNNNKINKVYEVATDEIKLTFDPNKKFVEALKKKIKET